MDMYTLILFYTDGRIETAKNKDGSLFIVTSERLFELKLVPKIIKIVAVNLESPNMPNYVVQRH